MKTLKREKKMKGQVEDIVQFGTLHFGKGCYTCIYEINKPFENMPKR
jgi:hypothetical protein